MHRTTTLPYLLRASALPSSIPPPLGQRRRKRDLSPKALGKGPLHSPSCWAPPGQPCTPCSGSQPGCSFSTVRRRGWAGRRGGLAGGRHILGPPPGSRLVPARRMQGCSAAARTTALGEARVGLPLGSQGCAALGQGAGLWRGANPACLTPGKSPGEVTGKEQLPGA